MNRIRHCTDAATLAELGAKGHALAHAAGAGLPVPAWFALTPATADAARTPAGGYAFTPTMRAELAAALAYLASPDDTFAVRSSAMDEDGSAASFAGQLDSFLFVRREAVEAHVVRVWLSARNARVHAYRKQRGLAYSSCLVPAVLVQRMIPADVAGVAFSADPVTGRRSVAVVAAAPGVATAIVAGERSGDTWRIDRAGTVEARSCEGTAPCLSDAQALEVADLARRCARHFGRPQDIEWAFADGQLWLLQSRPITTLADRPDPDAELAIWDSSNIAESYGGITTPLTFSFIRRCYEHVYREYCRAVGIGEPVIARHDATLRRMVGLVRGRVYYNLIAWYELLALTPAFAWNRRFLDEMLGVRDPAAAAVLERIHASARRVTTSAALLRQVAKLVGNFVAVERRNRRFRRDVDAALTAPAPALADMRMDELVGHFNDLERRLLRHWDAPLVNDFFAMVFHGVLARLVRHWIDPQGSALEHALVTGQSGIISAEPARRIDELARLAARDPPFAALLRDGALNAIRAELPRMDDFRRNLDEYVARFGDRCLEELKLESLTLGDDPLPLLRTVGQLAALPRGGRAVEPEFGVRGEAQVRVHKALLWHPLRRAVFAWVLGMARARLRDRENLRFDRTRVFARVRRIVVELGRRFHEQGLLDSPRDVFWLELGEILGFVEGTATCTDLKGYAALRRAEFERHRDTAPPPRRFETRGMALHGSACIAPAASAEAAHGNTLHATACSPGTVRGRVRVVTTPQGATLRAGEILVAERTDPGWVVLFSAAAGLVVERGTLLSHAAIVARELGLPAVVGVPGACRWLHDGDLVELDGSAGTVRLLEGRAEAVTA